MTATNKALTTAGVTLVLMLLVGTALYYYYVGAGGTEPRVPEPAVDALGVQEMERHSPANPPITEPTDPFPIPLDA